MPWTSATEAFENAMPAWVAPSIIASLAYDLSADGTFYVTMMGVSPERAAEFAQERGAIETITCGATHGYLPLLSSDRAADGQLRTPDGHSHHD